MVQEAVVTRLVRGADGRMWTIRSRVNWTEPVSEEEFEHDVAAGHVAGVVMLILVAALLVTVFIWTPDGVVVPAWLVLVLLALLLIFPLQWVARRTWTVVAETPGGLEMPPERWVGTIRGVFTTRQEVARAAKYLEENALPDDGQGPLQQVN